MEKINGLSSPVTVGLRAPELEDLQVMYELENGEDAANYSVATGPYSYYQLKKYILESGNDLFSDCQLRLMVELLPEKVVAGIIDVFDFSPRFRRAELGLIINKVYRRKGIARKALQMMEEHCRQLGVHQLYVYVQPDNVASLRLFQTEGYQHSGVLRDWFLQGKHYSDVWLFQKIL